MFRSVDAMTWAQLHERMTFMADLIDRAADDPEAALDLYGRLPDVERLFGGEAGLLLSLQQRWVTMLAAKLDQAAHDDVPAGHARAELAARHRGLRGLLDAAVRRSPEVRSVQRDEEHLMKVFGGLPAEGATGAGRRGRLPKPPVNRIGNDVLGELDERDKANQSANRNQSCSAAADAARAPVARYGADCVVSLPAPHHAVDAQALR